jgi:hypothetical protein
MESKGFTKSPDAAQVLVLGVFHFFYPGDGKHVVNTHPGDITTPKKQAEVLEVVEKLMKFKPNKIAVESPLASAKELNKAYHDYCMNEEMIYSKEIEHRGEIAQLGFRIAKNLNHKEIYPVDYPVDLPFETAFDYAKEHNPEFADEFMGEMNELGKIFDEMQRERTVGEAIRYYNDPELFIKDNHNSYLDFAKIGAGDSYCGAEYIRAWYDRNLRIFGNLQNIAKPDDRILLMYGAGHCAILREFVNSYKNMQLVDPLQYL